MLAMALAVSTSTDTALVQPIQDRWFKVGHQAISTQLLAARVMRARSRSISNSDSTPIAPNRIYFPNSSKTSHLCPPPMTYTSPRIGAL